MREAETLTAPLEPASAFSSLGELAESPRPWLFFRDGIDWRWLSYRRVARRVAEAESGRAPRDRTHFDVDAVVAHLASPEPVSPAGVSQVPDLLAALPGCSGARHIVFAAPEEGTLEIIATVTLRLGAAWALEPQADAFVATARWVRPTILVAPPPALDALSEAWDGGDRRWSRLRAVVAWPRGGEVPDSSRRGWSAVFGCNVGFA